MTDEKPSGPKDVLRSGAYLDTTYSPQRVPPGSYPRLLANYLLRTVYGKPGRLLDMGCGRGDHLAAFAAEGFEVAGLDTSPRAPELAPDFRVEVADMEADPLPFEAGSFDFVFSKSVIEHMHYPMYLISGAMEALKPGGLAVVMTPSWVHNAWGPFYIHHTHVTPFTAPSLEDALTTGGFESVRALHFHQLPFLWRMPFLKPLAWLIRKLPIPYRPFRRAPWPDGLNKLIRFSNEVMLLGVGRKPLAAGEGG